MKAKLVTRSSPSEFTPMFLPYSSYKDGVLLIEESTGSVVLKIVAGVVMMYDPEGIIAPGTIAHEDSMWQFRFGVFMGQLEVQN